MTRERAHNTIAEISKKTITNIESPFEKKRAMHFFHPTHPNWLLRIASYCLKPADISILIAFYTACIGQCQLCGDLIDLSFSNHRNNSQLIDHPYSNERHDISATF